VTAALVTTETSPQAIQQLVAAAAAIARGGSAAFGCRRWRRAFRGRARIAAVIVFEHTAQSVQQFGTAATARVTARTATGTGGVRDLHNRGIASAPGRCHQQERSIHEVSS